MLDLYHAPRDDLIRIILEQRDALADRDRQVARLAREIAELRQAVALRTARIGTLTRTPDADDPPAAAGPRAMVAPGCRPPIRWVTPWQPVRTVGRHWLGDASNGRGK